MNTEIQSRKISRKAETIAGLLFLMCLVGGYLSRVHYPWTCEQAKEAYGIHRGRDGQQAAADHAEGLRQRAGTQFARLLTCFL